MLVKVKMPKIGLTTEQVEVTAWLKNVGDTIEHDEILVTVEADKAAYEVPAPSGGKLIEIHGGRIHDKRRRYDCRYQA